VTRPRPGAPPADLLFVFAGMPSRKAAGLKAWRDGAARTLVLSVGRFEWRRVPALGLPDDGGLLALVESTPPPARHFFIILEGDRTEARLVPRGRYGTWREARALAALARERRATSLLICTSGYHMPRCLLSVRRALQGTSGPVPAEITVRPLPVTRIPGSDDVGERRWRSLRAWPELIVESVKQACYALFLRAS
jgi:uncharacterized SAM-binding protein YcdF (DUF218 family)